MKDLRIAAVIFKSVLYDAGSNLESMEKWVAAAKKERASIVCFPELNITGYGTEEKISGAAVKMPGKTSTAVSKMSSKYDLVILAGMAEKDKTGRIYASHMVANPDGSMGVYRKIHIAPVEKDIFSQGKDVRLFETGGVKFGIQLCYDAHFPELSARMAVMGADVIFIPHASPRGTPGEKLKSWMRHLPARAFDNSLFIVACNQCGQNSAGLQFPGAGLVIAPSGEVIGKYTGGKEGMIVAALTAKDLERVRGHKMRYFLPNRRPEIY
jgi:N-carbamoylputrescine amidase